MAEQDKGNIKQEYNVGKFGMDMDNSPNNIPKGRLTYALNGALENFDANGVQYQNEEGNTFVLDFPEGYVLIGKHFISEREKHIFFLVKRDKSGSQIGYMDNNDGVYRVLVNDAKLNFDPTHPIHKIVHRITDCSTEIYWPDNNGRRYLDIDNIPKILRFGSPLCSPIYEDDIDVNQLKIQSNFLIPSLSVESVNTGGELEAGTYQFAIQYSDESGNPYSSYYSITNPLPIANPNITSVNFNYNVGKSITVKVENLDVTGQFKYFNLAVVKTVNAISTPQLVGTYFIDNDNKSITYTGGSTNIPLSIADVFEKYPYYDMATDVTTAQDILIWSNLTSVDRINYQGIASKVHLQWETWRIPETEDYSNELNATNLRSYLRDEIYPFELVFLLKNGKQTDGFHIPGRVKDTTEKTKPDIAESDPDFIGSPEYYSGDVGYSPYWKIYNTATVKGFSPDYSNDSGYKGPYNYGEFSYWESTEEYPCNTELWGELAGQKIRHHKFPDVLVSPIYEAKDFSGVDDMEMGNTAIFPIGVRLDVAEIQQLINTSSLSKAQKEEIVGFKIVRGDRSTNKSIVAKGILRNVGEYTKEENTYYFPNYPYNDLNQDPFLNEKNNAFAQLCDAYEVTIDTLGPDGTADVKYTDCSTNKSNTYTYTDTGDYTICSASKPVVQAPATGSSGIATYEIWYVKNDKWFQGWTVGWVDPHEGYKEEDICAQQSFSTSCTEGGNIKVVIGTGGPKKVGGSADEDVTFIRTHIPESIGCKTTSPLPPVRENAIKNRQIFNSPETSFGQPFLGSILKLESVIYGKGLAHFTEVKNNAKYKLISEAAQRKALESAEAMTDSPFDATAMFTAYQAYLQIYLDGITKKNYAYSFNSIADYIYTQGVPNDQGIKQKNIDVSRYLIPGVQSINGDKINNYQRESSVYLRTMDDIPFPDEIPDVPITENSRFTISDTENCGAPAKETDINVVSYYASMKNNIVNQWGQVYSYPTVDTGYQRIFSDTSRSSTIFGGDTFISKFSFKTKLPFFIDNRVDAPDGSDIFYDEIGNIAYPKYWHSARSILKDYTVAGVGTLFNIISYKAHNFDCPNDTSDLVEDDGSSTVATTTTLPPGPIDSDLTFYDGYYYLFAYGVPSFYCETSYNLDLRQAFNNKEGEFWPHVSSGIPDDWVQETNVPIAQDNTYYYNTSFSKQNKENVFTHLPADWNNVCYTKYPFRAIYSDKQYTGSDNRINNWRIYKATSYFDFPQNYGGLTSLDGIQNSAILARFKNKTLLYNHLLTVDTSNPQAAYFGNPKLFEGAPPIDFADTDLGYVGCQNKMLLKIPQGQISIDAKRGQVFLIQGTQINDLAEFGSGMNRFFSDHMGFEILRYFPNVNIDNHFMGIGLHGVFDSKYSRVIITKLDYIPKTDDIKYDDETEEFYIETPIAANTCNLDGVALETIVPSSILPYTTFSTSPVVIRKTINVTDENYFCNKSWTLSYNLNTKSWVSFHSYLPNWYIGENSYFYSGINNCCGELDFIVGLSENTTTSTTTTSTSSTTTSTTTIFCNINYSIDEIDFIPTVTTTTTQAITGWNQIGNDFSISSGFTGITGLNSTDIVHINSSEELLKTLRFDGINWVQVGNSLSIPSIANLAITSLNSTDIVFIDAAFGHKSLMTYRFDGVDWTLIGTPLAVTSGTPTLATLSSSQIAMWDTTSDTLRAYNWNGALWSATGSGLLIPSTSYATITALDSTHVAYIDASNNLLQVYVFNGSTWTQEGNSLSIPSTGDSHALVALDSLNVAYIGGVTNPLTTYNWNGTDWFPVTGELNVGELTNGPKLAKLANNKIAAYLNTNGLLKTYIYY